jgi:hypothetical protein
MYRFVRTWGLAKRYGVGENGEVLHNEYDDAGNVRAEVNVDGGVEIK